METTKELAEAVRTRSGKRYEATLKERVKAYVAEERSKGSSWTEHGTQPEPRHIDPDIPFDI